MKHRGQIPGYPEPFVTRFDGGQIEIEDCGDGVFGFDIPGTVLLYPGERAEFGLTINHEERKVLYTVTITPAPGLRMWLLRLRYRLFGGYASDVPIVEIGPREADILHG